jgi:hypothetical protein
MENILKSFMLTVNLIFFLTQLSNLFIFLISIKIPSNMV